MSEERQSPACPEVGASESDATSRQAVTLRAFTGADAPRLAELDRSEPVAMVYAVRDGEIVPLGHGEEIPQWGGAWLSGVVTFARRSLECGGTGVAAFVGDQLAGVAVLGGEPVGGDPRTLPLAILHVGRGHRRLGVASLLFREVLEEAGRRGTRRLYISATPSEGALRFYLGQGARLADPPDPGLLALEPDDVHLVLDLDG
jgi:GNAT superfamily N-acetyltransferase